MVTPLHLRCDTIALGEKAETGKTTIIQRLTTDKQIIQELFDIV